MQIWWYSLLSIQEEDIWATSRLERKSKHNEKTKKKDDRACTAIKQSTARSRQLDSFIEDLQQQNLVRAFSERLWCSLVEVIYRIQQREHSDGTEIKV